MERRAKKYHTGHDKKDRETIQGVEESSGKERGYSPVGDDQGICSKSLCTNNAEDQNKLKKSLSWRGENVL
jgi:hypothetical protein